MATSRIVEHLDVIEDVGARQVTGFVDPLLDAFFLELGRVRCTRESPRQAAVRPFN